jgi:hypothetical protein
MGDFDLTSFEKKFLPESEKEIRKSDGIFSQSNAGSEVFLL